MEEPAVVEVTAPDAGAAVSASEVVAIIDSFAASVARLPSASGEVPAVEVFDRASVEAIIAEVLKRERSSC